MSGRLLNNSPTNQLADWSARRLVNSPTVSYKKITYTATIYSKFSLKYFGLSANCTVISVPIITHMQSKALHAVVFANFIFCRTISFCVFPRCTYFSSLCLCYHNLANKVSYITSDPDDTTGHVLRNESIRFSFKCTI